MFTVSIGTTTVKSFDKKSLSERDICTKFITPAIERAGWDNHTQIREEVGITRGRVIVKGKTVKRGEKKFADYILYHKPNIPVAVIEAKDNNHSISDGMQQALDYAELFDVPYAFSSNGDGFKFHDRTGASGVIEKELTLDEFPSRISFQETDDFRFGLSLFYAPLKVCPGLIVVTDGV
jgi:type I restriction enzyme R subunit